MVAYDAIDYSIRRNKSIQRDIIFSCIKNAVEKLKLKNQVYVGLGSFWFSDFECAKRQLDIRDMVSIEQEKIGYKRAVFNAPNENCIVKYGLSTVVIDELVRNDFYSGRPWVVWMDYDGPMQEIYLKDLELLVQSAPLNSFLIFTLSCEKRHYTNTDAKNLKLYKELNYCECIAKNKKNGKRNSLSTWIVESFESRINNAIGISSDERAYTPMFELIYKDGSNMLTTGGLLSAGENAALAGELATSPIWTGSSEIPVAIPPLTQKERRAIRELHLRYPKITKDLIQSVGFDLSADQIASINEYYEFEFQADN